MGAGGNSPSKAKKRDITNNQASQVTILPGNDQYLCPMCKNVPELVNVFTNNGYVEFKCKDHGNIILTVQQYFEKLNDSEFYYYNFKCPNCNKIQKDYFKEGIFKFCYDCRQIFCENCCKNKEIHKHFDEKNCLNVNEMNTRCPDHINEIYTTFCLDDYENVCETYSHRKHSGHNIKSFFKIEAKIKVIEEKNKILNDLIRFNNLIINTYRKFPDNYFHNINVKNLADLIEKENDRDPKELEKIFKALEASIRIKNRSIKEFKDKYNVEINGDEERLILRNRGLDDNFLRLLSKLRFSNLKEIDLSFNKIKNADYLQDMNLSELEYLSLNDNKIEDISFFKGMELNNIKELNLQNNDIKKIEPLMDVEMPVLELLRIDGNHDLTPVLNDMKKLIDKYKEQIVYVVQSFDDFSKKYDVKFRKTSKKLDFNGNSKGNEILKDLYLILPKDNELTELRLADCGISDISILTRLNLPKVENIDLSFNKIIHIEALCNMKENKLKRLYLNDNNISNISPLKRIKFYENRGKITIENNNIIIDSPEVKNILKELKAKNIEVKIDEI